MPQGRGAPADEGFASGNAEELIANRDAITRHDPDALLVLSADHAYRLDDRDVVEEHLARGAEDTLVTTEIDVAEAGHHTVVTTDGGRDPKADGSVLTPGARLEPGSVTDDA
jgi:glucose-1-phosphate adenylyltransferase